MPTEAEVFELFGRVSMKAQLFESSVGTLVISMRTIIGEPLVTEEEVLRYITAVDERTLGVLIGRVRRMSRTIDDDVEKALTAGLDARNGLAHGFFVRDAQVGCLDTQEGRLAMVAELNEKQRALMVADALVMQRGAWLQAELSKLGLPKREG